MSGNRHRKGDNERAVFQDLMCQGGLRCKRLVPLQSSSNLGVPGAQKAAPFFFQIFICLGQERTTADQRPLFIEFVPMRPSERRLGRGVPQVRDTEGSSSEDWN
jgi:hypothetical protein